MNSRISDLAVGAIVIALTIATVTYFLTRRDDCLENARGFVNTAPAVNAKTGKVISVGTSSWLSGQAATKGGERSFYFLVKGERATATAIVNINLATCSCRLESLN